MRPRLSILFINNVLPHNAGNSPCVLLSTFSSQTLKGSILQIISVEIHQVVPGSKHAEPHLQPKLGPQHKHKYIRNPARNQQKHTALSWPPWFCVSQIPWINNYLCHPGRKGMYDMAMKPPGFFIYKKCFHYLWKARHVNYTALSRKKYVPKTMPRSRTREEWGYGHASFAMFSFTSLFYCWGGGD